VTEGRTAELGIDQARKLFASIDTGNVVGLRDRAILGVLAYTGARVGAVAKLRLSDYRDLGEGRALRFREKGGKEREIPVRHDLAAWLNEYTAAAGIAEDSKSRRPLFRSADGKRKLLTLAPYGPHLSAR
jgi:integrase/recombinase XerD